MLKPGGKLMIIGIPREDRSVFCPDLIRRKEITLINVRRQITARKKPSIWSHKKVDLDYDYPYV